MKTSFLAILVCLLVAPSILADDFDDRWIKGPRLANPRRILGSRNGKRSKKSKKEEGGDVLVLCAPVLDLSLPSPGDPLYLDRDFNDQVGFYNFVCSPTGPLYWICSNTLSFYVDEDEEPELLTFQGVVYITEDGAPQSAAITGGTGHFSGATGLAKKATNFDFVTFKICFD